VKLRFTHLRLITEPDPRAKLDSLNLLTVGEARAQGKPVMARGGLTQVDAINEVGATLARGVAVCSPRDNYSRAVGRTLAVERLLDDALTTLDSTMARLEAAQGAADGNPF
jgi:hypothetical protein